MDFFHDLIFDYTVRTVSLGTILIGATSGVLGSFAVLRRQSLLGDAVSHCALPGVALAFLLTGRKDLMVLLTGAGLTGWLGAQLVTQIDKRTRIAYDGALGLVLAVFFGFGLVVLTFIQKMPNASQAGLDKFLFGQAATMLERDVITIAVLGAVAMILTGLFWKEWKLISFDPEYAQGLGWRVSMLDASLMSCLVLAVVLGLQSVGVVLMSAMIVAPAAAARQWTDRLAPMVAIAAAIGAISGLSGAWVSAETARMPTGPAIVLVAAAAVVLSLAFGSSRGLVWTWIRIRQRRSGVRVEQLLLAFFNLANQHEDPFEPRELALVKIVDMGRVERDDLLGLLEARGWLVRVGASHWALTETGIEIARSLEERRARIAREP